MSSKDYAIMPYSDYEGACDAIREKDGSSAPIKSGELRTKILGIETGADVSVVTAKAPDVLSGRVFVDKDGNPSTGTMPNRGSGGGTISSVQQTITIPEGYYYGSGKVSISATEQAKIIPSNIKDGVEILGIRGTAKPFLLRGSVTTEDGYSGKTSISFTTATPVTMDNLIGWYVFPGAGFSYAKVGRTRIVTIEGAADGTGVAYMTANSTSYNPTSTTSDIALTISESGGSYTITITSTNPDTTNGYRVFMPECTYQLLFILNS